MKNQDFYRHKMERPLFILSVILSFLIFIILSYLGYKATLGGAKDYLILQVLGVESEMADIVLTIGGYVAIRS